MQKLSTKSDTQSILSKNLKLRLSQLGFTQKDFAKSLGVSKTTFHAYTKRGSIPKPKFLLDICQKLKVDANTMLYVDIAAAGSIPLAIEQGLQLIGVKLADFPDYEVYLNKNITYLLSLRGMNTFEMCEELDIEEGYVDKLSSSDTISGLFPISEFLGVSLHSLIAVDLRKTSFESKSSSKLLLDKRNGGADDSPVLVSTKIDNEQGLASLRRENELLKQMLEDNKARLRDKEDIIAMLRKG